MMIRTKLIVGFGLMISLAAMISIMAMYNLDRSMRMERHMNHINQINYALLEVRHHEKEYIFYGGDINFQETFLWLNKLKELSGEQVRLTINDSERSVRWSRVVNFEIAYTKRFYKYVDRLREIHSEVGDTVRMEQLNKFDQEIVNTAQQIHQEFEELLIEERIHATESQVFTKRVFVVTVLVAMLISIVVIRLVMKSVTRSLRSGIRFSLAVGEGRMDILMEDPGDNEVSRLLMVLVNMRRNLVILEERNLRAMTSHILLTSLLETTLEPISLQEQLRVALQIILAIPCLSILKKGAIFLTDEESGTLHLAEAQGVSEELCSACDSVEPGQCLCGKVLSDGKFLVMKPSDKGHTINYEGMSPHGHYVAPILSNGKVLGVLALYLIDGHVADPGEEILIIEITSALAGVIERKRMEDQLRYVAYHDMLTNLPNRVLFKEHLDQGLLAVTRTKGRLAVMLIDLDYFKEINDTLGHAAGDQLLIQVAKRIKDCLRASDMVSRMGGDEFAAILADITHLCDVSVVAENILRSLAEPFILMERTCQIGASIGVSIFPDHGIKSDNLLAMADEAMYLVKKSGRNGFKYYNQDIPK